MKSFKKKYITKMGIQSIDAEHKELVDMINKVNKSLSDETTLVELDSILRTLLADTQEHFTYEEKLLEKYNFPELDKEEAEHQVFIDNLKDLIERNNSRFDMLVEIDLDDILKRWLTMHISAEDYMKSQVKP